MRVSMIDPSLFTLPYDQMLAEGLAGAGHQVRLHGRTPGPNDGDPGGFQVDRDFYRVSERLAAARLPAPLRLGLKGLDHLWSMVRLLARLRRERPDVIHFQWLPLPVVDRRILPAFRRVAPLVLTVHDTKPFNGDPTVGLQARGGHYGAFDRLIVHTQQGAVRLMEQGVPEGRLIVLPHGPIAASAAARTADPMDGVMTFMLFGKMKPYKGIDTLIEAFARLPAQMQAQARVRVVGKPYMDLKPLQARIQALGLAESIALEPRFVPDSEIPVLFGPGTVAVFPYRELEASGVLPRALAQGRPVLASDLGVFAETLADGVQGHLVPPSDVGALAAAMRHLIEDREFASSCGRQALLASESAESWDAIALQTAAVYRAAGSG